MPKELGHKKMMRTGSSESVRRHDCVAWNQCNDWVALFFSRVFHSGSTNSLADLQFMVALLESLES